MPEYTLEELKKCTKGNHLASRKRVVNGWMGFSQTERYYCACGSVCWIRYEGVFMEPTIWPAGSHLRWIEEETRANELTERRRNRA